MSDGARVMSFQEHLGELRRRLIRIVVLLGLGFFVCWQWRVELFAFLAGPISRTLADHGVYRYQAIEVTESVLVYLKTAFVGSVLLTSPLTFYQLWAFVAPGLLERERRFVYPVTAFTVIFFLIGTAFAYEVILPTVTDWLVSLGQQGGQVRVAITLQSAYSTAILFLLLFGLVFQLPMVIFFLALAEMVTARRLLGFFRYFVVLSVAAAALLTPPDPVSQVLLTVPVNLLYLFGILVAWGVERTRRRSADAEADGGGEPGSMLTRLMGGSLILLLIAGGLVVLLVRNLPQPPLRELLPERTRWMVAGNPAVLAEEGVPAGLAAEAREGQLLRVLEATELRTREVRRAVLAGAGDGERVLLLRHPSKLPARDELAAGLSEEADAAVRRLDATTWALGAPSLLDEVAAVEAGDASPLRANAAEERLLRDLRGRGPIRAWLPHPEEHLGAMLGPEIPAEDVAAAGGWARFGEEARTGLVLRTADERAGERLAGRLEAVRAAAGAQRRNRDAARLLESLRRLADEVRMLAPPPRRPRLRALQQELAELARDGDGGPSLPLLEEAGLSPSGWTLRRDRIRIALTGRLDDREARRLAAALVALLP